MWHEWSMAATSNPVGGVGHTGQVAQPVGDDRPDVVIKLTRVTIDLVEAAEIGVGNIATRTM
jgi:hypothetical protein